MGRGHLRLHEQLAPGGAYANNLGCGRRIQFYQREAGDGSLSLVLSGAMHGPQRASPPWPRMEMYQADKGLIGAAWENMNREMCKWVEDGTRADFAEDLRRGKFFDGRTPDIAVRQQEFDSYGSRSHAF